MAIGSGVLLLGVAENPTFPILSALAYTTGLGYRPSCDMRILAGVPLGGGLKWEWGGWRRQFFAILKSVKQWPTNRKSYTRFRLVPKSSTLDDPERPWTAKTQSNAEKLRFWSPTVQIWITIDPYMQRQKCSPMSLVSENIRYVRIFAGVPVGVGLKWGVGWLTTAIFGDLSGYFFRNFRDKASNIIWRYATPCWPVNDCKMNDPEWPWAAISRKTRFPH